MVQGLEALAEALGERARRDEPLALYTRMRVGGPADLLTICRTTEEVVEAVRLARSCGVPWWVLGGGCNVLVADAGVRGLVLIHQADRVQIEGDGTVWAEAGAPMVALARETAGRGLAGLEWAAGLPGTVGGAVVGNAGAFGGDIASVLRSATLLTPEGEVVERPGEWFEFEYRGSRLKGDAGARGCG
ncbi:MAG TPA: FAD-binding protein, partial [Anaerolineales bacterium]|nr:FAD-binding protein [Anaerolineales bacterium]